MARKYTNPWFDPAYRERTLPKTQANLRKAWAATKFPDHLVPQLLADYLTPHRGGWRRYQYTLKDLTLRYLICERVIIRIAAARGLRRNVEPKRNSSDIVREAA